MVFKPIQQQKIYEKIVEQIRNMVSSGMLKPGDRLPAERVLAESLNVSRASVREALSALQLMGLVEIKPGEGTFIKQMDIDSIIQPLAMLLLMERDTILEILEVRKGLEVEAAGLAAMNASEQQIDDIGKIIDEMEIEANKNNLGDLSDWKFHFAIAKASGNSLMVSIMNMISDVMQKTIRSNRERLFKREGNQDILVKQHKSIYEAIKARDSELARKNMYGHLSYAEEEMKRIGLD